MGPKELASWAITNGNNLGDDTVVAILIHKIREYYPDAEIVGFSLDPADTARRHGIKAFPIRHTKRYLSPASEPPLSRVDLKPTLYIELKQLLKKCPILFKPLQSLKIGLCGVLIRLREVLHDLPFWRRSFHQLRGCDLLSCLAQVPLPTGG